MAINGAKSCLVPGKAGRGEFWGKRGGGASPRCHHYTRRLHVSHHRRRLYLLVMGSASIRPKEVAFCRKQEISYSSSRGSSDFWSDFHPSCSDTRCEVIIDHQRHLSKPSFFFLSTPQPKQPKTILKLFPLMVTK